ncbi:EscR/YscR/HrcR family type III secretion system export apparatus protein [bacterium]|nr:EscR/YscR/HrcR family type III secretion system export apparatus protein [bacterium]
MENSLVNTFIFWQSLDLSSFGIAALLLTALTLSSFIKIVTVLGLVRAGFGVDNFPAGLIVTLLALVLSYFVMIPVIDRSVAQSVTAWNSSASLQPAERKATAVAAGFEVWKEFAWQQSDQDERNRFATLAEQLAKKKDFKADRKSWQVLVPAFVLTELKSAFTTGLTIFLPFLVIDLLTASILMGMGYTALNSQIVALPLKILLFVLADGWTLIMTNLVGSYI